MIVHDGFGDQAWFDAWYDAFEPEAIQRPLAFSGREFQPALAEGSVTILRRRWRFLRAPVNGHTPAYGWKLIQPPEVCELSRCLLETLRASRCHGIEVSLVPDRSPTLALIRKLATTRLWIVAIEEAEQNLIIDVDGQWVTYWNGLSRNLRKSLAKQERQLRKLGRVEFQDVGQVATWPDWFEKALTLEATGWKGQAGTAILQRPNEARFYRAVAHGAAEKQRLHLFLLTLDDRLIAFQLATGEDNVLFALKTTYDEELSHYGPGSILLRMIVRECFADPSLLALNLPGAAPWTRRWATRTDTLMRVRAVPARSAAGLCLRTEMYAKALRARLRKGRQGT